MVRNGVGSQKRKYEGASSSGMASAALSCLTILQNTIVKAAQGSATRNAGARVDDEPQTSRLGQNTAASQPDLSASFPIIHLAEGDLDFIDNGITDLLGEFENGAISPMLGTSASVSDTVNRTENEVNVANVGDQGAADAADFLMCSQFSVPAMLTPIDGYNSEDDFEPKKKIKSSSTSSSSKGKAKAKTPRMGVGSFGKGALFKSKPKGIESVATPSTSVPLSKKSARAENDDGSILKKMLAGSTSLPGKYSNKCKSDPKRPGCTKAQVKSDPATSKGPAGNSAVEAGCSSAVLPAPKVTTAQVIHVAESNVQPEVHLIESDEELDVFTQDSDNAIINHYRVLRERVRGEHAENLANVQRAEEDFRQADEAFRLAQEERRVALEQLKKDQRALDKSRKKMRTFATIHHFS